MSSKEALLRFAKTLAGHYSNFEQSQDNPKDFAHINIYFRPLPWETLKGPGFYSEQSYDHDPWSPYQQRCLEFAGVDESLVDRDSRDHGTGFYPELLRSLKVESLTPRCGCDMHFHEVETGCYRGEVEPGHKCLVPRDGQLTYLISEVDVDSTTWVSRDRGFDPETHAQKWGSEHGPLKFKRVTSLGDSLNLDWLR